MDCEHDLKQGVSSQSQKKFTAMPKQSISTRVHSKRLEQEVHHHHASVASDNRLAKLKGKVVHASTSKRINYEKSTSDYEVKKHLVYRQQGEFTA